MLGFGALGRFALGQIAGSYSQTLTATKLANANTVYIAVLEFGLIENRLVNVNTFGANSILVAQVLSSAKYTNTGIFYADVAIADQRFGTTKYTNITLFYSNILSQLAHLNVSKYVNTNSVNNASVSFTFIEANLNNQNVINPTIVNPFHSHSLINQSYVYPSSYRQGNAPQPYGRSNIIERFHKNYRLCDKTTLSPNMSPYWRFY